MHHLGGIGVEQGVVFGVAVGDDDRLNGGVGLSIPPALRQHRTGLELFPSVFTIGAQPTTI